MGSLDGKVAVITGAGSGMAKASVKVFVREGARVVAADISGAEKDTAAEVGAGVLPVHCDVTKEADVEAMIQAAVDEFGRLDAVLNVAGIAEGVMLTDVTMEHYDRTMDIDLRGVLLGMKHGIRAMLAADNGRRDRQLVVDRRPQLLDRDERVRRGQGRRDLPHEDRRAQVRRGRTSGSTRSARATSRPRSWVRRSRRCRAPRRTRRCADSGNRRRSPRSPRSSRPTGRRT